MRASLLEDSQLLIGPSCAARGVSMLMPTPGTPGTPGISRSWTQPYLILSVLPQCELGHRLACLRVSVDFMCLRYYFTIDVTNVITSCSLFFFIIHLYLFSLVNFMINELNISCEDNEEDDGNINIIKEYFFISKVN